MKEALPPMLRVRDWCHLYENNRSRDMVNTRWFPMPNDLSADGYVDLVSHPEGPAHLGVWTGLLMVASRAKPRGHLAREDGRPHDSESLARVIRQPEPVVKAAIPRLLTIGFLESGAGKPRRRSKLRPHPGAGIPQEGAVEGKGTEHHHQEGNGKEKKRTERADDERDPGGSRAGSSTDFFQRRVDDEAKPGEVYASPEDELKAIYRAKAGESMTLEVLDAIRVSLEVGRVSMGEFVSAARKHSRNDWHNPAGFLRDLAKRFRTKTQTARDPVTAAEAAEINFKCGDCSSTVRGEGALLIDGKSVPCSCASPEWIARQRARGIFEPESPK